MSGRRWIGYTRVSTQEQAASALGLEAQEAAVRAAVAAGGGELVELITDAGESGKDLDRPGLRRALDLIAAGDAEGLVVAKLDRVTRSVVDAVVLLEWFDDAGATLRALDLGLDTSTPAGRLVANVLAAVAQWERETIAQRTRDALAAKRAAGGRVSGASVASDAPDVADRIRARRAEGATFAAIAAELNDDGIPTLRGGSQWRTSSVQTVAGWRRPPARRKRPELPELPRRRRAAS